MGRQPVGLWFESQLWAKIWKMGFWQEHCHGALEQGREPPNAQSACPGQITGSEPSRACAWVINGSVPPLGINKVCLFLLGDLLVELDYHQSTPGQSVV